MLRQKKRTHRKEWGGDEETGEMGDRKGEDWKEAEMYVDRGGGEVECKRGSRGEGVVGIRRGG